jgi:hypothetical protein
MITKQTNIVTKILFSWLFAFFLVACVHSKESDVTITESPTDDLSFDQALQKAAKTRSVFSDFETRFILTAVYISPEFRAAFSKRLEKVYKKSDVELGEIGSKAGFLVTLQVFDDTRADLTNPEHWTVLLDSEGGPVRPILIKPLADKERWRAFFPSINQWSHDFLVVFDVPGVDANTPKLVEKSDVSLTFANADAQVALTW